VDTRTAIVTGASSGIGLALAQAYQSRHRRDPSLDLTHPTQPCLYSSGLSNSVTRIEERVNDFAVSG
jgi:hypothetical protein